MKKNKIRNKILSFSVAAAIFSAAIPTNLISRRVDAIDNVIEDSRVSINGVEVNAKQSLSRNLNGTYNLNLDISSNFTYKDFSKRSSKTTTCWKTLLCFVGTSPLVVTSV